ncbi:VOC family protein [Leifsonia naganoensis]|uniref:Putative enzyme related to lactoylglutathione lyase n=1 Tax=Leifsonia naganoensis TaxID=150025 RepID=A0A853DQ64_9MICO|nr:VOC family protein [Leifsonia naganoensis]NYK08250.1 putative enzyme related to lactoylglutathione lyase [Leifsonia naganoensis]
MPTIESFPPGTPIWVDLQSSDQPAAVAFYRAFFGWDAPDATAETGGYSIATLHGIPVTAVGPLPAGVERSVWTLYFAVADIDASAAAATAGGGAVLLPPGDLAPASGSRSSPTRPVPSSASGSGSMTHPGCATSPAPSTGWSSSSTGWRGRSPSTSPCWA